MYLFNRTLRLFSKDVRILGKGIEKRSYLKKADATSLITIFWDTFILASSYPELKASCILNLHATPVVNAQECLPTHIANYSTPTCEGLLINKGVQRQNESKRKRQRHDLRETNPDNIISEQISIT